VQGLSAYCKALQRARFVTLSDAKGACLEACPLRVAQGDGGV